MAVALEPFDAIRRRLRPALPVLAPYRAPEIADLIRRIDVALKR